MTGARRRPLPRLRPTHEARRRCLRRAYAALQAEGKHGRLGEAAARRGDVAAAEARLRAMEAHRGVALRWMRVACGRPPAGID